MRAQGANTRMEEQEIIDSTDYKITSVDLLTQLDTIRSEKISEIPTEPT